MSSNFGHRVYTAAELAELALPPGGSSGAIQYNNGGAFGGFGAYYSSGSPLSSGAYVDLFGNGNFVSDTSGDLRLGPAAFGSNFIFNSSGFIWNDYGVGEIGFGDTYTSSLALLGLGADGSIGTQTGTWAINGDGSGFLPWSSWDTSGNLTVNNNLSIPNGGLSIYTADIATLYVGGYTGAAFFGATAGDGVDPTVEFINTTGNPALQWGSVQGTAAGTLNYDGSASFANDGAVIDATGNVTAATLNANNGYTGTVTTSSLVGKTITITNGIITGFA